MCMCECACVCVREVESSNTLLERTVVVPVIVVAHGFLVGMGCALSAALCIRECGACFVMTILSQLGNDNVHNYSRL